MPIPATTQDFIWWGFQLSILALMWFIRKDVKGMRDDLRQNQRVNNWLRHAVLMWYGRCALLHPEKPMPPLGEDPDNS